MGIEQALAIVKEVLDEFSKIYPELVITKNETAEIIRNVILITNKNCRSEQAFNSYAKKVASGYIDEKIDEMIMTHL